MLLRMQPSQLHEVLTPLTATDQGKATLGFFCRWPILYPKSASVSAMVQLVPVEKSYPRAFEKGFLQTTHAVPGKQHESNSSSIARTLLPPMKAPQARTDQHPIHPRLLSSQAPCHNDCYPASRISSVQDCSLKRVEDDLGRG